MAVPGANGDDDDDGNEEDDRDFSKLPQLNVQHEDEFSGGREISVAEYSGECFVEGNPDGNDAVGVVGENEDGEWDDTLAVDVEGADTDTGSPQKMSGPTVRQWFLRRISA
jgi:hypothetical protein